MSKRKNDREKVPPAHSAQNDLSRRKFLAKSGGLAAGALLGLYVKPSFKSIGASPAYAAITPGPTPEPPTDPPPGPPVCLVIIDEDTIDNDISTIKDAALLHGVTPAQLVNDDYPVEVGNPPLLWNSSYAPDEVILPGGEVTDEGIFALPTAIHYADDRETDSENIYTSNLAQFMADFVDGTVDQRFLDKLLDVTPLRNNDLRALVGRECIAVVYDSDISMNEDPRYGNLQGDRYGLFRFEVLDVRLPGLPESTSDTSLLDLRFRVLPLPFPGDITLYPFEPVDPSSSQEADTVQTTRAEVDVRAGQINVEATSSEQPAATLNVSIGVAGLPETSPVDMIYNAADERYEFTAPGSAADVGKTVTISSDLGGAFNDVLALP